MGRARLSGQSGGGSNIKSIQSGTYVFDFSVAPTSSKSITVAGVDINKSILKMTVIKNTSSNVQYSSLVRGELTSNNTITFSTNGELSGAYAVTIRWELFEFNNVKSVQSGSVASSTGSDGTFKVTIAAVDPLKCISFSSYRSKTGVSSNVSNLPGVHSNSYVSGPTELSIANTSIGSNALVHWKILEFI